MNDLSNFETDFKDNFDSDIPEIKTFPFFSLPDLVISKILKEYVPVTDKVDTLSQIPEFEPYLSRKGLWFQSTLKLFNVVKSMKPGWYVDFDNLHNRYYVSIDYFNLSFMIYSFCSRFSGFQKIQYEKKCHHPLSNVQAVVEKFNYFHLTPVKQNDVLVYHWSTRHPYRNVFFWVFRSQNVVRTSFTDKEYRLEQNKCLILNSLIHDHYIILTLKDDMSIVFCCETCGDLSCQKCKNKPKEEDTVLLPLLFRISKTEIDPMDFSKYKIPIKKPFIYAVSKLTFTEFNKENVLVFNNHFIQTMTLGNLNIISAWCKDDERKSYYRDVHWLRIFLRMPFHKYRLPL